jgi:catechol 2,3-dioxygenase-like lactoylglutathione lyase family enzyme
MAITLNHAIVPARDKEASAKFFAQIFGLEYEGAKGHFAPVRLNETLTLDFDNWDHFEMSSLRVPRGRRGVRRDLRAHQRGRHSVRERSILARGYADQYLAWRAWGVFQGSQRPRTRAPDPHLIG